MLNGYQLVVFDWDGTLVDSIDWIVECVHFAARCERLREPSLDEVQDVIGLSLSGAMRQLFGALPADAVERMVTHYRQQYLSKSSRPSDVFPGVTDLLDQLSAQGKTLAIATGKSRQGLEHAMAGTGIGHYFADSRCADETHSKPNPHMLFELMKRCAVDSERTVMIGDSTLDMEMAQKAGTSAIGVTTGVHDANRLRQYPLLACLDDLSAIINDGP